MALNWDDLRVFLAVARGGSLSSAARILKVTQPTAGRRLRALEESLGARLFDRLPEGFVPTVAGSKLMPLAEQMERSAEAVVRRQASLADRVTGTVRISTNETMAQFLTARLVELRKRLPDLEIEVAVSHTPANLSRREADLVIRECLPESPGLIVRKLCTVAFAVYGARELVERCPAARSEARYRDCDWVGFDEEHNYFTEQKWLLKRLDGRQLDVRVNDAMLLTDMVRGGAGLGVLPCLVGDFDAGLTRVTTPLPDLQTVQHLIVHRDLQRVPSVRAVIEELVALCERSAEAFASEPFVDTVLRTA